MSDLARALVFGFAVVIATLAGTFDRARDLFTDHLLRTRNEIDADARIAVVGVTDDCLNQLGQWPWPRARHAALIDKLAAARPALIVCDMTFAEPSHLGEADDAALEAAIRKAGNVVLPITVAAAQAIPTRLGHGWMEASSGLTNLPRFNAAAAYVGHVHFTPDADGIVRAYIPLLRVAGKPHLAAPLYAAASLNAIKLDREASTAHPLFRALEVLPADDGRVAINFLGRSQSPFEILPYAGLLSGEVPERAITGRVVILGGASTALHDSKTTPFGLMYGMEILAHATSNLLAGNALRLPAPLQEVLGALAAALLAAWLTRRLGPVRGPLVTGVAGWVWWRLAVGLIRARALVLPLAPVFAGAATTSAGLALLTASAALKRRREEADARERIARTLDDTAADIAAGRLQLAQERLSSLPQLTGADAVRVRSLNLRALLAGQAELALETYLDREDLSSLPHAELIAAAATLEERARHDLAERLLNVLHALKLPEPLATKVYDDRERVSSLKAKAGLASPLLPLARRTLGEDYRQVV